VQDCQHWTAVSKSFMTCHWRSLLTICPYYLKLDIDIFANFHVTLTLLRYSALTLLSCRLVVVFLRCFWCCWLGDKKSSILYKISHRQSPKCLLWTISRNSV